MKNKLSSPDQWLPLHGDILYRYGLSRVRDNEVAEDLVQETLLAAFKAMDSFSGQSTEQTWLLGILKHKIIDYFRKASRDPVLEYEDTGSNQPDDYFDQRGRWQVDLSVWSKPEQQMEQEQFMAVLQECISRLPPKMEQLFIMNEFDNMNAREICSVLAISSMNNFWVILSRARMQLRHCLDIHWLKQ